MSDLEVLLHNAGTHVDWDGRTDVPSDVFEVLTALVEEVRTLKGAGVGPLAPAPGAMFRADALKTAREHVEAMSTKANGYQDVKLSDKVQAVDRFARFLMGEAA